MAENRNRDPHLILVAPAVGATARHHAGLDFPLPRRHRRLLAVTGATAALVLGALSAGAALQQLHDSVTGPSAAAPATR